ncbi:protein phosphatase 2C domain-containing protein [Microbacterium sp. 1.5R]|uniref:protein phosphatase 2C domain-containing protein n=1 Tax=Microbacterium sp. 1.5R TaxID=1916917 RepID=UPI0011A2A557|nr:protein phosphatase 2C domain-containing protein [Microbacterium sp. 1.5R]
MRVELRSEPGSAERENEDWVGASSGVFVVVDGAGSPPELGTGCSHGVAWYATRLGSTALGFGEDRDRSLVDALGLAIADVAALHADTCDLTHPGTPSAAIALARRTGEGSSSRLEYAVLADCSVLIVGRRHAEVITDRREASAGAEFLTAGAWSPIDAPGHLDEIASYMERMRAHRNKPGGFWVAASDPSAASEAIHGSRELEDAAAVVLLSDGASRPIDLFQNMTPEELVTRLTVSGSTAFLADLRDWERSDPNGVTWPRAKRHDDASVVAWFHDERQVQR